MLNITLAGHAFGLPENWTELPAKRLPRLLELLFAAPETGETHHELLRLTLGLSVKEWKRLNAHYFAARLDDATRQANARVLHDLLTAISWMWQTDLTTAPVASIRVKSGVLGETYLVFAEGFTSMTFGELTDAYIHARAFVKQLVPGESRLNLLLATICRPATETENENGDPREPYLPARSEQRASLMASVPAAERVAVLLYFLGTLKDFLAHYDLWEQDSIEATVAEEEYPGQGFIKNQHLLAEKGVFGNLKEVKQANVHDVFLYLEEHRKDELAQLEAEKAAAAKS